VNKKLCFLLVLLFVVAIVGACAFRCPCRCLKADPVDIQSQKVNKNICKHPKLSPQQKLIACATCHKEVTPNIYKQWYNSGHGLDNVKCFQCHGTYENFRVVPDISTCAACHAKQCAKTVSDKTCWQCHPAHRFTVHK